MPTRAAASAWELLGDERGRDLLDALGTMVWVADPSTLELTFVSRPLAALLRRDPHEKPPVHLAQHVHADDRAAVLARCAEVARTGEARRLDYRAVVRDGGELWLAGELRALRDKAGAIRSVAAVVVDITAQRAAIEARTRAALREQEELVNTLDGIVWETLESFQFTFVSKQAERLLGYPVSRWLEDPMFWMNHLHPEDREWCVTLCRAQAELRQPHQFEYRMIAADGRVVWLRDYVTMIVEANGRVRLRGVMVDISEQKRAESALRESEERYRYFYNNTPVMMHSIGQDGTLISVSNAWLEALGYERSEVIGHKSVEFLTPESRRYAQEVVLPDYFKTGMCKDVPYQFVKKNGETIDVLLSATAERDGRGEILRSVAVLIDVTQRKRAEAERDRLLVKERTARSSAEQALALLNTLLMSAPVGLAFLDRELRYARVNTTLAALNGHPPEAHVGKTLAEMIPELSKRVEPLARKVLETGEPIIGVESTSETPGQPGQPRTRLMSYYPVRTAGGELLGVGAVVLDVTEERLAAELHARLYREAQEAIRVRDDFLAIASHELKTPLTPLAIYLQSLERRLRAGEPGDVSVVEKALRQLHRLTGLINDLLDASRIQAGRLALHLEPTSLRELVRELVASQPSSPLHQFDFDEPTEALVVDGDRARLAQVVVNLLDNAVKYSPDGGTIRVRLWQQKGEALLAVSDPGIGIPKEQQPFLFDRFFRATNSPISRYGGLGLGLYISQDIVERHGGRIWVESEVGRGATFYVALPLAGSMLRPG